MKEQILPAEGKLGILMPGLGAVATTTPLTKTSWTSRLWRLMKQSRTLCLLSPRHLRLLILLHR